MSPTTTRFGRRAHPHPSGRRLRLTAFGLAVVGTCLAMSAERADAFERQQHLGGGVGGAMLAGDGTKVSFGANLGLHYAYGVHDKWNLLVEAGTSIVPMRLEVPAGSVTSNPTLFAWSGAAGIAYVFDVLQWVPYVGVLGGAYLLHGDAMAEAKVAPGLQAALGVDYQVSRNFALGLALRQHFMLTQLDTFPVYTTALLRAEYAWGW